MNKITLYPHQENAVQRMMAEPTKSILIASEMDQGKTVMAIEFALRMGFKRVLFIGIKDTYDQFRLRVEAQSSGKQTLQEIDSTKKGASAQANLEWGFDGWYFIGQQLFTTRDWEKVAAVRGDGTPIMDEKTHKQRMDTVRKRYWDDLELDMILYDEVHMAANHQALGSKTIQSVHPEWKVAMSGTFWGNKFDNAWAPTKWLWPDLIPSYWTWRTRWCAQQDIRLKGGKTTKAVLGEKEPEGTFVESLPCYIRHVGADKVPAPKIIKVDLLPEQRRMYDSLESNLLVWKKGHPFTVDLPITLRTRLRTVTLAEFDFDPETQEVFFLEDAESTKLDALWGELEQYPSERVILTTHSKQFAKITVARMKARGMSVVEWSGDISSTGRQAIKEAWLAGEVQYIVCVTKSFSTGLDWAQTDCWRIGWLSRSDDPTVNDQFVRRVFRTGPHKKKFEHFEIQATNTYDAGVFANNELKRLQQQSIMKGEVA